MRFRSVPDAQVEAPCNLCPQHPWDLASDHNVAAIDVFPQEPLGPGHPIRSAPNVVISAHRAGSVREALWEIDEMVLEDLEAIGNGAPPQRMQRA